MQQKRCINNRNIFRTNEITNKMITETRILRYNEIQLKKINIDREFKVGIQINFDEHSQIWLHRDHLKQRIQ